MDNLKGCAQLIDALMSLMFMVAALVAFYSWLWSDGAWQTWVLLYIAASVTHD